MIRMALGDDGIVFDAPAYWSMSDRLQRIEMLKCVCDRKTAESILDKEASLRAQVNELAGDRKRAESTLSRLSEQVSKYPPVAGNASALTAELDALRGQERELAEAVAAGDANDEARKTAEARLKEVPKLEERIKGFEAAAKEQAAAVAGKIKAIQSLDEPTVTHIYNTPPAIRGVVESAIQKLEGYNVFETVGEKQSAAIAEVIQILSALLPNEEEETEARAFLKRVEKLQTEKGEAESMLRRIERQLDQARGQLREARKHERDAEKIGPGATDEQRRALSGIRARREEIQAKLLAATELDTIRSEMEKARIEAETAKKAESDKKEELSKSIEEQADLLEESHAAIISLMNDVLPHGSAMIEDDGKTLRVGWVTDDGKFISRQTLSGGERVLFDAAFSHAMSQGATVYLDAGEVDDVTMPKVLAQLIESPSIKQVIVARWRRPSETLPCGVKLIDMEALK